MAGDVAVPVKPPEAPRLPDVFYDRLMSLTLRHDFYDGDLFPDFVITPTIPTQALMRNLGLIARPRRGGVDIIYPTGRAAGILRYLHTARQRRRDAGRKSGQTAPSVNRPSTYAGSWTRLTFTLSLQSDLFANFTDMPFTTKLGEQALYLSNRYTKKADGEPGQLNAKWAEHCYSVLPIIFSPENLHLTMPEDATDFTLYDVSGRAVLCADLKYTPPKDGPSEFPPRARLTPKRDLHISMANEWPGLFRYDIKTTGRAEPDSKLVFYAGMPAAPLLFAELYLASPDEPARPSGWYPIELPEKLADELDVTAGSAARAKANAAARAFFTPRDYELRFQARETIWTYYIARASGEALPRDLAIRSEPEGLLEFIRFDEPLPTGAKAFRFTATKAMPLRRRSDVVLRLHGGAPGNGSSRVLLERLPTPSAERITAQTSSQVFVYL